MFVEVIHYLTGVVNSLSSADLLIIAGLLATGLQGLAKKYRQLGDLENWLLSFALPFLTALLPYLHVPKIEWGVYGGLVYFVSQVVYFTVTQLKASAVKQATTQTIPV